MQTTVWGMAWSDWVVVGFLVLLPTVIQAQPRPVAYVTNSSWDTVSVIDTVTNTVEATVVVGPGLRPLGIAMNRDGTLAYVANPDADTVSEVDLQTMTTTTIVLPNCPELGCRPEAVVVSPDGAFVYVLNHPFNAVWVEVIDTATHGVVAHTAPNTCGYSGGIATIAITPDGSTVYATGPCGLSVIDTATRAEVTQLPGDYSDVAVTPDGSQVYLAGFRQVTVVDTSTNLIAATLLVAPLPSQQSPSLVGVSPNGRVAYVVAGTALLLIDVATATLQDTIDLGQNKYPWEIAVLPDGTQVALATAEALMLLDTTTNTITRSFALPRVPQAMAVTPDGRFAYLTNQQSSSGGDNGGALSMADLKTGAVSQFFPAAVPSAVAATPDGMVVYVANTGSDEIAVIDASAARVRTSIPIYRPAAVVVDPKGTEAYVSARSSDERDAAGIIGVINTSTSTLVATIPVEGIPGSLVLTPHCDRLYAATHGGLDVIDTTTRSARQVALGQFASRVDLAIAPDGTHLYEALLTVFDPRYVVGEVVVVDTTDDQVRTSIGSGGFSGVVVAPHGSTAYATGWSGLAIIDTATNAITDTIPVFGDQLAITPDGKFLYLVNNQVTVLDTLTHSIVARIPVGKNPSAITIANAPSALTPLPTGTPMPPPSDTPTATLGITPNEPTVTPTATVTGSPTESLGVVSIGGAGGEAGASVEFDVSFDDYNRFVVSNIHNCITINANMPFERISANEPDCTVAPALQKHTQGSFTFVPTGCNPALDCQSMCADIIGGIPEFGRTVVYSCRVLIPTGTEDGIYWLGCGPTAIDGIMQNFNCDEGSIVVQTRVPGDCSRDGMVTIAELVTGVNVALGRLPLAACSALDRNFDGAAMIDELIEAVTAALNG